MRVNSISPRVAELVLYITKRYKLKIVQVHAPTIIACSEEDINSFYNDVDETLWKPNHYMIVMGDFNAEIRKTTYPMETATAKFGFELRNESGDTFVEWARSRKYKSLNTMFKKKTGRRWTWKSPNGVTKTEIDYILTNKPDIDTDVTVINQVNIGSDHRLVMIKLDVEVERDKLMTKRLPRVDATCIGAKKIELQLELRNRFETLQELEDVIDTMSEAITATIQQSALRVAQAI